MSSESLEVSKIIVEGIMNLGKALNEGSPEYKKLLEILNSMDRSEAKGLYALGFHNVFKGHYRGGSPQYVSIPDVLADPQFKRKLNAHLDAFDPSSLTTRT